MSLVLNPLCEMDQQLVLHLQCVTIHYDLLIIISYLWKVISVQD